VIGHPMSFASSPDRANQRSGTRPLTEGVPDGLARRICLPDFPVRAAQTPAAMRRGVAA